MRFAAITPVFNEKPLITGCIKCLEDFVDEHIVLVSDKPYYGENYVDDGTAEAAERLGATVIRGNWELDHHQRNTGIALLQEYDWIICTDVDMWLTRDDMIDLINKLKRSTSDALVIAQNAYWYDVDHVLDGDDFMPVIAIRPHVRFSHIGNVDHPVEVIDDIRIHHINWCNPKDIHKKVTTYSHAPEFDGNKWYQDNYKLGSVAKMPCGKEFKVKEQSLPDELKKYLN